MPSLKFVKGPQPVNERVDLVEQPGRHLHRSSFQRSRAVRTWPNPSVAVNELLFMAWATTAGPPRLWPPGDRWTVSRSKPSHSAGCLSNDPPGGADSSG